MSQAFPFATGTGTPSDAAAASESSTATEIAVSKGFWRDFKAWTERVVVLLRNIQTPPWYDNTSANNALRVTFPTTTTLSNVTSISTLSTVSTVTTLTNQSQIGGVDAKTAFADQIMLSAWNNSIRARLA